MIKGSIEEFIYKSNACNSVKELFTLYEKKMIQYGFDRVLFALMTDHPLLEKEAEHGVVKNYPADWLSHYFSQKYDEVDPVRSHAFCSHGTFTWEFIANKYNLTSKQLKMFNEAKESDFYNGVGVSLRGSHGTIAGVGAASTEKNIDINPLILDQINLFTNQFYICFCRLLEKQCLPQKTIQLSQREQEILKWVARGLSQNSIADKLVISSNTVDTHIRNIKSKLGTSNITVTVVLALNMGLIQI